MRIFITERKKAIEVVLQAKELLGQAQELFEDFVEEEISCFHDIEVRLYALGSRIKTSIRSSIAREWDEEGL